MALFQHTPPAGEVLDLAAVKAFLRVDATADDALIGALIIAARQRAEGPAGITGRALMTQTWDWSFDLFPVCGTGRLGTVPLDLALKVPLPPLQSVSSITYVDCDGDLQTLDPSKYAVDIASQPGRISPAYGEVWPVTRRQMNAVSVRFVAGYSNAGAVPGLIGQAMLLLIGAWYENRDALSLDVPPAVADLLSQYRVYSY